jgi:hypothetical protein
MQELSCTVDVGEYTVVSLSKSHDYADKLLKILNNLSFEMEHSRGVINVTILEQYILDSFQELITTKTNGLGSLHENSDYGDSGHNY